MSRRKSGALAPGWVPWLRGFTCVAVAVLTTACGPSLAQISAFGTASMTLAKSAEEGFHAADAAVAERKLALIAIDPARSPTPADFEGILSDEALQTRLALVLQVGAYAGALKSLAEADYRKDIDAASAELYGALKGIAGTYARASGKAAPLTDAQLGVIATAVDAIGAAVNEAKKRVAIRRVILEADAGVRAAADLIGQELGDRGVLADVLYTSLDTHVSVLKVNYDRIRALPTTTFDDRLKRLVVLRQAYVARNASKTFTVAIGNAAKSLAGAHAALRAAAEKDTLTSTEVVTAVTELAAFATSVKQFQKSLDGSP